MFPRHLQEIFVKGEIVSAVIGYFYLLAEGFNSRPFNVNLDSRELVVFGTYLGCNGTQKENVYALNYERSAMFGKVTPKQNRKDSQVFQNSAIWEH